MAQWSLASLSGLSVTCGLSLLFVLFLALRFFSPGHLVFPPSSKANIFQIASIITKGLVTNEC